MRALLYNLDMPALPCGHIMLLLPAHAGGAKEKDGGKKKGKSKIKRVMFDDDDVGLGTTVSVEPVEPVPIEAIVTTSMLRAMRHGADVTMDGNDLRVHADSLLDVFDLPRPVGRNHKYGGIRRIWDGMDETKAETSYEYDSGWRAPRGWAGPAPSLKDYAALVQKGDPVAAEKIRSLVRSLEDQAPAAVEIRRRTGWRCDGDEVDMDRIRNGEIDRGWWGAIRKNRVVNPILHVYVNVICSYGTDSDEMFWPGAAASAIADLAENAGWRVMLTALDSTYPDATRDTSGRVVGRSPDIGRLDVTWPVKRSDEPLDLEMLATSLCHASAGRTAGFALYMHGLDQRGFGSGKRPGMCAFGKPKFVTDDDVYVGPECRNEHTARKAVLVALEILKTRIAGGNVNG